MVKQQVEGWEDAQTKGVQGRDAGAEGLQPETKIWVTSGGKRSPRLEKRGVTASEVRSFLKSYDRDKQGIEFFSGDGKERRVANWRELVAPSIQATITYRQFGGKQLNKKILLPGLRKLACIEDEFDETQILADMSGLLRLNSRFSFDDRFTRVQDNLFGYLEDHDLFESVMPNGKWKPGAGNVMVKAMLKGLWPLEFRRRSKGHSKRT